MIGLCGRTVTLLTVEMHVELTCVIHIYTIVFFSELTQLRHSLQCHTDIRWMHGKV
jgi:hypothetical protein